MPDDVPEVSDLGPVPDMPRITASPSITSEETMSEAARSILLTQFELMLKHQGELDADHHHDAVHDMRVAIRRMRSAIHLFSVYFKKNTPLTDYQKTLKSVAVALGAVRDLNVFEGDLEAFLKTLPEGEQNGLQDMRGDLKSEVHHAERTLHKILKSAQYACLIEDFRAFLTSSGVGARVVDKTQPYQVRHVVPELVYARYTAVRAYETAFDGASLETLHALRIACKQLRYTLEFFTDVLGTEVKQVIDATRTMQDYLGRLQDARVSSEWLETYMKRTDNPADHAILTNYLATRQDLKTELRSGLPNAWKTYSERKIRRALALSVAAL